jgi:hypothetical protein
VYKKNIIIFDSLFPLNLMGYPVKYKMEDKWLETLFHELAGLTEEEVSKKLNRTERTINNYMKKLTKHLCPDEETDKVLIYFNAMSIPELIDFLLKEYGPRFPEEARRIRKRYSHRFCVSEENGKKVAYLWSWKEDEPLR